MSDLISRQAAIDAIRASTSKYTGLMEMEMYTDDDAVEAINGVPSAQPEKRTDKRTETRACDCISRKAAIDAVRTYYDDEYALADSIEELIEKLPSAQPEQRWVPCSERLPEEGERVLATHLGGINPNNQVIEHIYQHGKFTCGWDMDMNVDSPTFGQRYMGKVIAWMPLPEPYKGERKDNEYTD